MNIVLNLIATIGIVAQFLLEHLVSKEERKKVIGGAIMVITAIVLWGSMAVQKKESTELANNLNDLKSMNIDLQAQIRNRDVDISQIRLQNDSLRSLLTEVGKQQTEFNIIGRKTAEEVTRSREAIETMRNKSAARIVSSYDKPQLVSILGRSHGPIRITSVMGDQEGFQFASELKEVFASAGWQVDGVNQALYTAPIIGVIVRVKIQRYPKRVDDIVQAFNVLGLKVKGELDSSLGPNDVDLIIGGR